MYTVATLCTHVGKNLDFCFWEIAPRTLNALVEIPEEYFSHKTKEFNDAARNSPGQLRASKNLPVRAGPGSKIVSRAGPGRALKKLAGPGRVGPKQFFLAHGCPRVPVANYGAGRRKSKTFVIKKWLYSAPKIFTCPTVKIPTPITWFMNAA